MNTQMYNSETRENNREIVYQKNYNKNNSHLSYTYLRIQLLRNPTSEKQRCREKEIERSSVPDRKKNINIKFSYYYNACYFPTQFINFK